METDETPAREETQEEIRKTCDSIAQFLLEKNRRYGNSALNPVKIFSRLKGATGIDTRIDDKLSRIANSEELRKNDTVDLVGYLLLKCVEKGWTDFSDQID